MSHYSINREYGITKYLTATEERELIALGQAGDCQARNAVVMNILPIIVRDVGKAFIDRKRVPLDDIVNDAVARMIEKFNEFDLSRGLRFSTWAWWLIRDAVSRYKRSHLYKRNGGYQNEMLFDNSSIDGMDNVRRKTEPKYIVSRVLAVNRPHDEDQEWLQVNMESLDKRSRLVLNRRIEGGTLKQIGNELGMTRENVRLIQNAAIKRLRKTYLQGAAA